MSNVTLGGIPNSYLPQPSAWTRRRQQRRPEFRRGAEECRSERGSAEQQCWAQVSNLLQGGGNGDMTSVMIAVEKADVSFQLMMQVRNKIVSAYQDIEKMQF
jgi:flagellar hook-basal body complex protein FliE